MDKDISATVAAVPLRTTVGGTVNISAKVLAFEDAEGTYDIEWYVVGPEKIRRQGVQISLTGVTTVTGSQIELTTDEKELTATLETSSMNVGLWYVGIRLTRADRESQVTDEPFEELSNPIEVLARPFAAGDDVAVTLKRAAVPPTPDQVLWSRIRNSTNSIGFDRYSQFLEVVMCAGRPGIDSLRSNDTRHHLRKINRRTALPFPNVDRYRLLKAATEVFLMTHCGVDLDDFSDADLDEESRRLNRTVAQGDLEREMACYLTRVAAGDGEFLSVLPYLGLIRRQLRDVPIVGTDGDEEAADICQGIIAEKLAYPCFLELLWSYWHEEGNLVRTINVIALRFQNRTRAPSGRDPLAGLEIDPLRPLSNLLWGWIQDAQHRLTSTRLAYEYDHAYGVVPSSKAGPPVRGADSRSRFIESYHNLLSVCAEFFRRDDDTTVIADGFGVLNALKETHMILSQGAHNQYGDLPWTARHEMLMNQWILARPELREFLPTRTMAVEPEPWISRVEAMNRLQGWSDTAVLHFRDLAVFGEQLLLSIRFGNWTQENQPDSAANWARYWRSEVQRYTHAYRAVTGVDLIRRADPVIPSFHLRRRHLAHRG